MLEALTQLGPSVVAVLAVLLVPVQERWARAREKRERDDERAQEITAAAAAVVDRHRREVRALLMSLTELARVIRLTVEEDERLRHEIAHTEPVARDGVRGAMREAQARCWDLQLDCPPELAKITAATMESTQRVVSAALDGLSYAEGKEVPDAADALSLRYGDECRSYFTRDDTAPILSAGSSASIRMIPPSTPSPGDDGARASEPPAPA